MTEDMSEKLQAIVSAAENHIRVLRTLGFEDTAGMFAIAKLDLQTKLHGISDEELNAFCEALDAAAGLATKAEVIELASRRSRKA
jgi:hypothetical protein